MEKQIQGGDVELGEIQPEREGQEIRLGAGSFIATDSNEGRDEERKALLKRLAAAKGRHGPQFASWKLWAVVGLTVVSCVALLWALFAGATPDKFVAPFATYAKCVPGSELDAQYKANKRKDNCPDQAWLPTECKDELRTKSMTYMDNCSRLFADCNYSLALLKKCNLITEP